jgi:hypothetical protein
MANTASLSGASLTAVHRRFAAALPGMTRVLRRHLRRLPGRLQEELLADAQGAAWAAWHGLLRRGRDPREVGPAGIARNAARYVRNGRKLGCGSIGCTAIDVFDWRARRRSHRGVFSLDRAEPNPSGPAAEGWRAWLVEDRRARPDAAAAFRIDFAAWLDRLPARKRLMAERLAAGETTGAVARTLGVTPAAVSMTRAWLAADWRAFQGEADVRSQRRRSRQSPAGGGVAAGAGCVTRWVTPEEASGQPETSPSVPGHAFQEKRSDKRSSNGEDSAVVIPVSAGVSPARDRRDLWHGAPTS